MLLKLTTTHQPATDLGYLLSKHPGRTQSVSLSFGTAHVFYPEASDQRCSAVLLVDVDPVGLVRGKGESDGPLAQYVNDRPYVASSFLAVAIAQVFSSAMAGRSRDRADLAMQAIDLEIELPVVRSRGGETQLQHWFEPLGYRCEISALPLDETFPEWGESRYFRLRLTGRLRLADALTHLYVLLPALDGEKHYFIGSAEVDKLLDKGGDWLAAHPQREAILRGYLKRRLSLVEDALQRLGSGAVDDLADERADGGDEGELERTISLAEQRMATVESTLSQLNVRSVLDLGCGEGKLLRMLMKNRRFERILGMDVSKLALERAAERLDLDRMPSSQRTRINLAQGGCTYRDARMRGFDAICLVEVVEHIDVSRLAALESVVFADARPEVVLVTTPNREYNACFAGLPAARFRHRDHRFEWTRAEFADWAAQVAERHGYQVRFEGIGPVDPSFGTPTQMAVFTQ
ncbi:MAG TPA: 3' terminal RNA ribose 2'-O-methyltransferase Hen1 [Xanthomonadales bacterium]|nr:3' terminal RNA ribose 2'-O-methyltransferase Hen1 [Xanthomonadales bacterium]